MRQTALLELGSNSNMIFLLQCIEARFSGAAQGAGAVADCAILFHADLWSLPHLLGHTRPDFSFFKGSRFLRQDGNSLRNSEQSPVGRQCLSRKTDGRLRRHRLNGMMMLTGKGLAGYGHHQRREKNSPSLVLQITSRSLLIRRHRSRWPSALG